VFGCVCEVFFSIEKVPARQSIPVMYPSQTKASCPANNTSTDKTDLVQQAAFPSLPTDAFEQWDQHTCLAAAQLMRETPVVALTIFKTAINQFRSL